jgi:hypothetical protein
MTHYRKFNGHPGLHLLGLASILHINLPVN